MKVFGLLFLVLLTSCLSRQLAHKTGIEEITFGNGGGFTGEIITYKLTADCRLFEKGIELKKVDSKRILELFNQAKELKDINFNEPGNMSSFLEIKTKERNIRIVWAYGSTTVDIKVIELYNELLATTK